MIVKVLLMFMVVNIFCLDVKAQNFERFRIGNAEDKEVFDLDFSMTIMGGATEVDTAMVKFLESAKGGDVLVLRTSGSDGYNAYMYQELGVAVNSVTTIVCHNRDASYDSEVIDAIVQAEAIWFAGGDQWDYLQFWRDTPVQSLINFALLDRGIAVGGTSAGMAILGSYQFSAEFGTVTSGEALADPYDEAVALSYERFVILPLPYPMIFDTHFDNPDRRGRLAVFLARHQADNNQRSVGLALDEYTAMYYQDGVVTFLNDDASFQDDYAYIYAYDCSIDADEFTVEAGVPLTWTGDHLQALRFRSDPMGSVSMDLVDGTLATEMGVSQYDVNIVMGAIDLKEKSLNHFPWECDGSTGIGADPEVSSSLRPNPSNYSISMEANGPILSVIAYDVSGLSQGLPYQWIDAQVTVDITSLRAGMYYLDVRTETATIKKPFTKI